MNPGNRCKKARLKAGVSRKKLAASLRMCSKRLKQFEDGKADIELSKIIRIAEITRTDFNELCFGVLTPEPIKRLHAIDKEYEDSLQIVRNFKLRLASISADLANQHAVKVKDALNSLHAELFGSPLF